MLEFYYTGANSFNKEQRVASLSIGNYISASNIPNSLLGNLFGPISEFSLQKGVREVRCIALKNTGAKDITQIVFQIVKEASVISKFRGFFILPAEGDCKDYYFEKILDPRSIPTAGELEDLEGGNIIVNIQLQPGEYVGLWLQRIVTKNSDIPSLECPECDTLREEFLQGNPSLSEELYKLEFDYTEAP